MSKVTLYKSDSKGRIRVWQCWSGTNKEGEAGMYTTDGLLDGNMKEPGFKKSEEKNIGKSNYLNHQAQARAMVINARDKKLKKDYHLSLEEASTIEKKFLPTGCPSGMKWPEWKNKSHVKYPALASAKLDGSKDVMLRREGRSFSQTRSALEHKNFKHIDDSLGKFFEDNPSIVLDGEAYNHDYKDRFEELQSIFKKQNPTPEQRQLSKDVAKFYIYDAIDTDNMGMTAIERQALLTSIFEKYDMEHCVYWPSTVVNSEEEYDKFHNECVEQGFEGSVLKIIDQPYIQRKNKYVMKRKEVYDCEVKIVEIIEGTGTKDGMAATILIDITSIDGMNKEDASKLIGTIQEAGMGKGWDHDKCVEMLKNKSDYEGKMGTFEYFGITNGGKMRFPKFKAIRND